MTQIIGDHLTEIIITIFALCSALIVSNAVMAVKLYGINKKAERFFGSKGDRRSLEALLDGYMAKAEAVDDKYDGILTLIDNINERMRFCVQKVGVVRFNPFDGMGGDLSFVVALLDEGNNGVVICTLHAREASYTYAKPISAGESSYTLSTEERKAVALAMEHNRLVVAYNE